MLLDQVKKCGNESFIEKGAKEVFVNYLIPFLV